MTKPNTEKSLNVFYFRIDNQNLYHVGFSKLDFPEEKDIFLAIEEHIINRGMPEERITNGDPPSRSCYVPFKIEWKEEDSDKWNTWNMGLEVVRK